ncbi:hypothetical protein EMM73_08725 [Rheinheimera sediminis]|uniref:hypothetical protein n=1 Tax=Rheinheimera sp. YQF-1 TaxID=2499626 RepID=UPI000FDBDCE0|nr:hypothetical protein [Rheinheimera sp. YQF-1]RVT46372.1 hypothetical protein EMM73_08725 [Rheinheimera sp. YQF-1]
MINAVKHAKRNALKNSLKVVIVGFPLVGVLVGTAFGVMLGAGFHLEQNLWQSPAVFSLVVGTALLLGVTWYYAKKIEQL